MIVIPAVDIRQGACVQLVGGVPDEERVRLPDPFAVARDWAHAGFQHLHVVDLDAAMDRGNNTNLVEEIVRDGAASVQVGGGIRTTDQIERLFEIGASQVVVGTRAIEEPEWLANVASLYPGLLIVAADVRDRRVVTRGWVRTMPRDVLEFISELNQFPLGGVLVTAVHVEGQMRGADLALMEDVAEQAHMRVIASGGVGSMADLRALEHRGIGATIVGMALYTGALDGRMVAQEFAS